MTNIEFIDEVDSTNAYLKRKLKNTQVSPPFAILAALQTQGKGRLSNRWHSEKGKNVLMSLLVDNIPLDKMASLNHVAALAVTKTLEHFGASGAQIKWPNDVYINNQKIAGILIENVIEGRKIKYGIVGIGLNVNQQSFDGLYATSIVKEVNMHHEIQSVAAYLSDMFYYFMNKEEDELLTNVNGQLFKKDKLVTFNGPKEYKDYRIKQVLANGNLEVVQDDKHILELQYHTHKWVK